MALGGERGVKHHLFFSAEKRMMGVIKSESSPLFFFFCFI